MTCRICSAEVSVLLDLGTSPPANSLKKSPEQVQDSYPLVLDICDNCGNVQLRDCLDEEALYKDYFYVTPSSTLLSRHYDFLQSFLFKNNYLTNNSFALEIGSNVGLFLDHIKPNVAKVVGIDPAQEISELANQKGIETVCDFFNEASSVKLKEQFGNPDIILARHCFAHNCDPHRMLKGVTHLLDDSGFFVIENAYLLNTIENNEFDQIYHEHMFYYSIRSMKALLAIHNMHLVDIIMSPIHGGSIVFVAKKVSAEDKISSAVGKYTLQEDLLLTPSAFQHFVENTWRIKDTLSRLITGLRDGGWTIYTYGATAKGNTLLNFIGLTDQEIKYCVDSTPLKQGKYLPKSNVKVISEEESQENPPDYFLLTAWNYRDEIVNKVRQAGNYTSQFIVPIPFVHIL